MQNSQAFKVKVRHHWHVECRDKRGRLLWVEDLDNLVTTEGFNKYLDATLVGGYASPTWYVGLVDNANFVSYNAADTASLITTAENAPYTNGWQEIITYNQATRPVWNGSTPSSASTSNIASPAVFTINASKTIRGAFLVSSSTKGSTAGALLGEADFAGTHSVVSGNIVTVTATCSMS